MTTFATEHFDRQYQTHLKHLKLKGLQPKTIDAYSRAIRRVGDYFYRRIDTLTEAQLTDYILGLRLGEGLRLQVSDIDAAHGHVHIRNAKGNRDRLVPLPQATHNLLRRFSSVHRNPVLLFPSRQGGVKAAATATTPMDPGGVQTTLHKVIDTCGLKKRSRLTV